MHVLHCLVGSKASIIHYSNALPFKAEHKHNQLNG